MKDDGDDEAARLKIAVVGRPNVGKSSLTNALLGKERMVVTPIAGTTRDAVNSVMTYYGEQIVLMMPADFAGRVTSRKVLGCTARCAQAVPSTVVDVAIVVVDATRVWKHKTSGSSTK
ncbi:MAG: 50S ribosome-binding GTPase [Ignavibacteria bacterium]|nr:50S ribosome-binding GTPase [Ignavibacteria bacterium]